MMTLSFAFFLFMVIFAFIGAMRGWAKELLVTFSVIVALFVLEVMQRYLGPMRGFFAEPNGASEFWVRFFIIVALVFFGYQTPRLAKFGEGKFVREKFRDSILGFITGWMNGFLIIGTLWFFLADSNYPFKNYITRPDAAPLFWAYLAPMWLKVPVIYFAIAVAFIFIIIVLI
jgi:uncharacterized membrane protein required for colicin V production